MPYPILAPNSTWYKGTMNRSAITEINIVDNYTVTGNESESWNADVDNYGSIKCYITGTVLTISGNGSGKISMNEDSRAIFNCLPGGIDNFFISCASINGLNLLDSSSVTNLRHAFESCILLTELDLSMWDISNVTDLYMAFGTSSKVGTMALTTLNVSNWNTSSCTILSGMFQNCPSLTTLDVSNWDTSSCTNMSHMFNKCTSLTTLDVSNWDTSSCTNMSFMFNHCTSLTTLDVSNWDVGNVTTFKAMFSQSDYGLISCPITTLDVSNWDTSSATDMGWMFYGMTNLKSLDISNWDVSKVESFHHCFAWCTNLVIERLENWDVSSAKYLNAMFHSNITSSYDLSNWNVSNVESFAQMFERNIFATEIKGLGKWNTSNGKSFYEMFSGCNALRELDLSSFNTRNANESWIDPMRSAAGGGIYRMFGGQPEGESWEYNYMMNLRKIKLGENFSFNGDGTCSPALLPVPLVDYIEDSDGYWYDKNAIPYSNTSVPSNNQMTYFASNTLIDTECLIKYGTLCGIANAIRQKIGSSDLINVSNMADNITGITGGGIGKTVELRAVRSESSVEFIYITPDGNYAEDFLNTIDVIQIHAPSFLVCTRGLGDAIYGYHLKSGARCVWSTNESPGVYLPYDANIVVFYVDGNSPVVFDYIPADNEPTN